MAQYPLQEGNDTAVADSLNYLLSGPSGLGQDFNGVFAWTPGWLTGNFRIPYTVDSLNYNATGSTGDTFVSVNPLATGVAVGMIVAGYGIPPLTTVTSIGGTTPTGVQVNLSAALIQDVDNDLYFAKYPFPQLYVAPIACSSAVRLDDYSFKYTFTTPQASPPFLQGNTVYGVGWADPFYNGSWQPIGVSECTTTYVVVKTRNPYPSQPDDLGGGTIEYFSVRDVPTVNAISTDCNSKIVVNGGTDRVFISAQLNNSFTWTASTPSNLSYAVAINRYKGFPNSDPANPGFTFDLDKLIAKRVYSGAGYTNLTGTGTITVETIFSNFPDTNISTGYYWYILDVSFQVTNGGDLQVTQSDLGLRSMSTQVVKQ